MKKRVMKEIELTNGKVALVDDDDYEKLILHKWQLYPYGSCYAVRKGSKRIGEPRTVRMHREIMNAPKGIQVDHINGNGLDNRKSNLRFANTQQNAFNKEKRNINCTSKYKGVLQRKGSSTWIVRIKFNNRQFHLGSYKSETYAAAVYNVASRIMFGVYCRENQGKEIPVLSNQEEYLVFLKCDRFITKYGLCINTITYNDFKKVVIP